MSDLLVPLYNLPSTTVPESVVIRLSAPWESIEVVSWIKQEFGILWASEASVAIHRQPSRCLIALEHNHLVGFACFDTTAKGFFGPTGVLTRMRGQGIGKSLLLESLHAMKTDGYGYAIIGDAGPVDFYKKFLNLFEIPNSKPGIYHDPIKTDG